MCPVWSVCTCWPWPPANAMPRSTGTITTATIPIRVSLFHCSNLPKDLFQDASVAAGNPAKMDYQEIIAGTVGKANTFRHLCGKGKSRSDELCPLLDRRSPWGDSRLYRAGPLYRRSAGDFRPAQVWRKFRSCKNFSNIFAMKASNITWRPTSAKCRRPFTKQRYATWNGRATIIRSLKTKTGNRDQGTGIRNMRGRTVGIALITGSPLVL